mmetsp:Transcript_4321/g.7261  ORF Transcript_4321/g.7261 Transcript_4321/m.7261 type:complete len:176 (+) Transcript_4321:130-657(+)|eukprot:CAMPEP_0202690698 /NCGR_PEP_ID=MMETSP1385-20130828/5615_1 /ASSEMBLY_ACC=CAM_ASM_000861 /TAXON_ID=933848 /ORGANISM="Elphidium margaritaceum" /LENGTH=175 /DNA_ID=CAMNT_0049345985 /DNA_START=122 /DNA_END=649 /DNA_ORIENTATION=+
MQPSPTLERLPVGKEAVVALFGCSLPLSIAAVIIAWAYDPLTSPCTDTDYVIPFDVFLNVAGYSSIALMAFTTLGIALDHYFSFSVNFIISLFFVNLFASFFFMVWGALGLYMFNHEMSDECTEYPMSVMILSWSVVHVVGIAMFVMFAICLGSGLLAPYGFGKDDTDTERQPLV